MHILSLITSLFFLKNDLRLDVEMLHNLRFDDTEYNVDVHFIETKFKLKNTHETVKLQLQTQ